MNRRDAIKAVADDEGVIAQRHFCDVLAKLTENAPRYDVREYSMTREADPSGSGLTLSRELDATFQDGTRWHWQGPEAEFRQAVDSVPWPYAGGQ